MPSAFCGPTITIWIYLNYFKAHILLRVATFPSPLVYLARYFLLTKQDEYLSSI